MGKIEEIRIYCGVYEQGLDFKDYLLHILNSLKISAPIKIIYASKCKFNKNIISKILEVKNQDIIITAVSNNIECPIIVIEYSTAVPTDDHIMQRSDSVYWGSKLNIPSLKISPLNKRMGEKKRHGGGNKITTELETFLAIKTGAPYYSIKWKNIDGSEKLEFNPLRPSCIPYSEEMSKIFFNLIQTYLDSDTPLDYSVRSFEMYLAENEDIINSFNLDNIKTIFPNSSRLRWVEDKITIKINRFGHAMDPDRGIVYFMNMLIGTKKVIAEIQIQRPNMEGRESYYSLYCGVPSKQKIIQKVSDIFYNNGNNMTPREAFDLFLDGMNLHDDLRKSKWVSDSEIYLDDLELTTLLGKYGGMSRKFLFLLSQSLILTGVNRNLILRIMWNNEISSQYLCNYKCDDYTPSPIRKISNKYVTEDLITFASAEVIKKAGIKLMAISYPSAQGDACILVGEGRKVDREYVDIIAYRDTDLDAINLFLQENKDELTKSREDVFKLRKIKAEQQNEVRRLVQQTIHKTSVNDITIGLGTKTPKRMIPYEVDYIMTFDLELLSNNLIEWKIWTTDMRIISEFITAQDSDGKLKGEINIGDLYIIDN